MKGAGGTNGGILEFFLGVAMAAGGGYMLTQTVTVRFGEWFSFWGYDSFGLALVPLMFGVGLLFFDGSSIAGRILTVAGVAIVVFGVLLQMRLGWARTSLFNVIVMVVLLSGGLGLIARSVRPFEKEEPAAD